MLCSIHSFRVVAQASTAVPRVGARPLFLRKDQIEDPMNTLQTEIEQRLAHSEPEIEVLLAEVLGGRSLRVFIDHPDGVNLAMCERVTMLLNDMRERYSLEVSSPGSERPLTKPAHFRRFVGRKARVRVRHPRPVPPGGARDGERAAGAQLHRRARGGFRGRGHARRRRWRDRDPVLGDPPFEPDRGVRESHVTRNP